MRCPWYTHELYDLCFSCFVRFASQFRGGTLGSRMEKMSSNNSMHINKPSVIWRGGFKMPPHKVPTSAHERLRQHQHQQQQQYRQQLQQQHRHRAETAGAVGDGGRRAGDSGGGGRITIGASSSQILPPSDAALGPGGIDSSRDGRLPGIPNMLDSASAGGRETSGAGVVGGVVGVGGRNKRVSVGSLAASSDAPHRGRFVRQR